MAAPPDTAIFHLKEWQDLLAGVLGFGGAITAIVYTATSERRRRAAEAKALRQALGIELRDMAANVLRVYESLPMEGVSISIEELVNRVRFVEPIIYQSTAGNIVAVGEHANAVVYFHSQVRYCVDGVLRLRSTIKQGWPISESQRRDTAAALANALRAARIAIGHLEPASGAEGRRDQVFIARLDKALTDRSEPLTGV
jgi:hypothetical protein